MAIKTDGTSIIIPAGDSGEIAVTPYVGKEKLPYKLNDGEKVVFTVYKPNRIKTVVEKTSSLQDENGTVVFTLLPEDTNIPKGCYGWRVKIIDETGRLIDTFIGGTVPAAFYVK